MSETVHGEGTLYQRPRFRFEDGVKIPDGLFWQAARDVPVDLLPEGIERKRITGSGETKREARRKLDENYQKYLRKISDGEEAKPRRDKNPNDSLTVGEWFEDWFDSYRGHLAPETLTRQKGHIRLHVLPILGDVKFGELRSRDHWEPWFQEISAKKKYKNGAMTDEPLLTEPGLLNVYKTVHAAMEAAREKLSIEHRFSRRLLLAPVPKEAMSTDEVVANGKQMKRLFGGLLSIEDPRYDQFFIAFTGLRAAERLGLTLDSIIDLEGSEPRLRISSQQCYTSELGTYIKHETKTKKIRFIPLKGRELESIKRLHQRRLALDGTEGFAAELGFERALFLRPDGRLIRTREETRTWHKLLAEFDIPYFNLHALRSITATWFSERGVDKETVGALLGHQSVVMTRFYARETEMRTRRALAEVDFFSESRDE